MTDSKKGAARPPPSKTKRSHPLGRTSEPLPVRLTQEELLDRGDKLAQVEADLRAHALHAKAIRKELRERESRLKADRTELAGVVLSKHELREVEVEAFLAARAGHVDDVRADTGEVVRTRPAKAGELQGRLPLAGEELVS